jgi:uncharacterized protein (DUF4415 family)
MASKRNIIRPTPEEDAAINAGIAQDPDSPELEEEFFKRARPASEVLPGLIGKAGAEALLKKRGRPVGSGKKEQLTVRFDTEVIEAFKGAGEGWQTKMNDALKDWLKTHRVG